MFPRIFSWLKGRRRQTFSCRTAYRPQLDLLEERLTPTLYKIAATVTAGVPNTFTSLSQAVAVAVDGDQIVIQPGANPGSATITQNHLLLQGDPSAGYLGLQSAGTQIPSLVLFGNNDVLANLCVGSVTIGAGVTGEYIANSLFFSQGVTQTPGTPSNFATDGGNTVIGCTFVNGSQVRLGNTAGSTFTTAANDNISNNVFWNPVSNAIVVQNETAGLTIANNRINHTNPNSGTAFILAIDCVGSISGNLISGTAAPGAVGILAKDFNVIDQQTTNLTIANNVVTTNQTAIEVQRFSSTNAFTVAVTNNTLAANQVGLVITGNSAGAGSDYGTLTIADNDFRGYSGTNGNFAIMAVDGAFFPAVSPGTPNTLTAQSNFFSVTNPQTLISTTNAPGTTITVATLLTTGQANLLAMFQALGGGPPTSAQLTNLGKASVGDQAVAAVTSGQAAKVFVDNLYVSLLGRMAGASEDLSWVSNLSVAGWSEEQVLIGFLTSTEYYAKVTQGSTNPNGAWVQSLYVNLLGRQASGAEIAGWVAAVPSQGLGLIAQGFIFSAEFRSYQVTAMYGGGNLGVIFAPNLLKRRSAPSAGELAGWIGPGRYLRQIEAQILTSGEFALNG